MDTAFVYFLSDYREFFLDKISDILCKSAIVRWLTLPSLKFELR